ncbi:MAG: toxin-antitoxin system YwqK family antitoxin [Cardiobacterium hominis]
MTKQTTILTLVLALASPVALACTPGVGGGPAGDPQCMYPIFQQNSLYNNSNNTYAEPAPVYRQPPPPPTHDCTARAEGGKTCFDTRPGHIGSSFSTNAAGDFDGPTAETYPDGTLKRITNYRDGEVGEVTDFYPDGTIERVTPHQNGEMHGTVKHYRENGTLENDITYCNGETCGEQHNYDEQGNIVKIIRWGANGDAEERRDYDEQGNLVRIIRYDANGDVESVQEITPGRKPRKKS